MSPQTPAAHAPPAEHLLQWGQLVTATTVVVGAFWFIVRPLVRAGARAVLREDLARLDALEATVAKLEGLPAAVEKVESAVTRLIDHLLEAGLPGRRDA